MGEGVKGKMKTLTLEKWHGKSAWGDMQPAAWLWKGGQSPETSLGGWETAALQVIQALQGVGVSCLNLHI